LTNICRENPKLFNAGLHILQIIRRSSYVYIVNNSIKYFVVRQQCKANAFLRFHGNVGYANAPLCYVIRTVLELYSLKFKQKNSLFSSLTSLSFLLPFCPSYTLNILSFCPCCHYYSFPPLFRLFDVTIFISRSKYSVITETKCQ